jgi:hypothetical protein
VQLVFNIAQNKPLNGERKLKKESDIEIIILM